MESCANDPDNLIPIFQQMHSESEKTRSDMIKVANASAADIFGFFAQMEKEEERCFSSHDKINADVSDAERNWDSSASIGDRKAQFEATISTFQKMEEDISSMAKSIYNLAVKEAEE